MMKLAVILTLTLIPFAVAFASPMTPEARGKYEVITKDFVYAAADGVELMARIYRPKTDQPVHAVVDVHPGAWNHFDRMAGRLYDHALASSGILVMAIDFRQGPNHKHPAASCDVAAAVRYLKIHAQRLNIDAAIGLIGSSSGGHLALLTGILPDAPMHQKTRVKMPDNTEDPVLSVSAQVLYVIALWPVSDPLYRYEYAKRSGREKLVVAHHGYFSSTEDMEKAAVAGIIKQGKHQCLPPILVVQPGKDDNIPVEMTFALITAYQDAGGSVDYAFYPGQPHAFGHRPSADTDDCIRLMGNFIQRQLAKAAGKAAEK